ncbi:hypothetical protein COHA_002518 [Chlorella ohadii]|uniref:LOW PSII ACCUMULATION chloroplastic n=1 Tax=Chlorella ohadii TaxID=2649997 RepID=A0AAD5H830_9CHLO|nr:hypothetical protein COHA_002518 [Chlorella ohadii]
MSLSAARVDVPSRTVAHHGRPFTPARPGAARRAVFASAEPQKGKKKGATPDSMTAYRPPSLEGASLRAEAEAPFRGFRLFIFGAGAVGAGLATLFGLPQLIGALGGAPNATKSAAEALQDFAINVGSFSALAFLVQRDLKARDKQMARLLREDELGACQLELANKKVLRLAQLRGFARVVLIAGTPAQVAAALAAAEPYKQQLQERGVLVVPLPFMAASGSSSAEEEAAAATALAPPGAEDLRWRATPIRLGDWQAWFQKQAAMAGKGLADGLYVSLRLDGRVRGSGLGSPPWAALAVQLPPTEGVFKGFLDGMDGRIGTFD